MKKLMMIGVFSGSNGHSSMSPAHIPLQLVSLVMKKKPYLFLATVSH